MENEQLAVPFELTNVNRNFVERIIHKFNIVLTKSISFIFRKIISFMLIILMIPVIGLIRLRKIINNDKTSIFILKKKIGKNGKEFYQLNFNSKNEHFLMKSGLSHFPEVVNVFLGNMNFVGPKAYNVDDREKMGEYYTYIIQHKPGITGVNQIADNRKLKFDDRLENDFRYHYRKSFLLNLKLVIITFLVTLRKKDTYYRIKNQLGISKNDFKTIFCEIIKRIIDIISGAIGVIILIPLTLFIKIGNMLCGDFGKVFFIQERIGKNGKTFKMYKFRSMVENADEKLKEILENDEQAALEFSQNKKLKNDPRVTRIGKFIRRTSIDELPQLINILKGDMSLVGPRPYLPREVEDMGAYYSLIIRSKPGLTGLWQISGRSNTTFDNRMRYDRQYNREKSLKTDIKILLKTVGIVFKGEGAA